MAVDALVLDILEERGARTLERLERELAQIGSAQLLFAIDRLSRSGKISIAPPTKGDYLVWAIPDAPNGNLRVDPVPKNKKASQS
jgi:hypothetical protein